MKKQYFLAVAVASLLLATGCQKEQELVTLGAEISQPAKTYIDNRYPCWNEGDQVYVNTAVYPVSAISGSSAQIADVVGADAYRAIFPASLVTPGSNITNSATIPVTLPATQRYQVVDGHQRVDAPMGAYTEGSTLQFYNLCSIVHVVVNNNTGSDMTLGSLKVEAANAMLSGTGTATVNGVDDDGITLSSDASHAVSLRLSGATNVTLAAGAQSAFDIYLPAFPTDTVTITLSTTNGYYFELTKSNVALRPNTYTTVTLNVDQLTQILAAELVNGWTFNAAIPDNATAVVFEYNSSVSSGTLLSTSNSPVPIYGNLDGTTWRVSTSASMINANPYSGVMFRGEYNSSHAQYESCLSEINFGDGFNTTNVRTMEGLFKGCNLLTSINLTGFNTSNVTIMSEMFSNCRGLSNLDLSNFNTVNVTNMTSMFSNCRGLSNLDLSNFNTENVTGMGLMFQNCSSLTGLDLSNFNTENVTSMIGMFGNCSSLRSLDVSNFNTENVTSMYGMFSFCRNLWSLDLSNFNTSNVRDMGSMFSYCDRLMRLDLSNFNSENVTNMVNMFNKCSNLTSIDLSNFNTVNVTDMRAMFSECTNLTSLDLSNFNTMNVTNMGAMFSGCINLTSLNVSNFNTENVTNMGQLFYKCSSLTSLDLSNFNTENVTNMSQMFAICSTMTNLNISTFNTENVTNMSWMFHACNSLTNLDLSIFNTENVTNMSCMFYGCYNLARLDLSGSNTVGVSDMERMFFSCNNLLWLDLSHFDMDNVTNKSYMCSGLSQSSGACSITCPAAVRSALESGTQLPTSGVAFTWVTPASK